MAARPGPVGGRGGAGSSVVWPGQPHAGAANMLAALYPEWG